MYSVFGLNFLNKCIILFANNKKKPKINIKGFWGSHLLIKTKTMYSQRNYVQSTGVEPANGRTKVCCCFMSKPLNYLAILQCCHFKVLALTSVHNRLCLTLPNTDMILTTDFIQKRYCFTRKYYLHLLTLFRLLLFLIARNQLICDYSK